MTCVAYTVSVVSRCPATYLSSTTEDPEPMTQAHLLYSRRIVSLPHPVVEDDEESDPDYYSSNQMRTKVDRQGMLLQHFQSRWKKEYLTALWELHRTTGTNEQIVNIGDVVQIHDDTPRSQWKLGVIEELTRGNDGYIRSVTVRTAGGRTNRPIVRLYPLEVSASESLASKESEGPSQQVTEHQQDIHDSQNTMTQQQPVRRAIIRARDQMTERTNMLRWPPEDMEDVTL